jgi:hypothetical protein
MVDEATRAPTDDPCVLALRLLDDGHPLTAMKLLRVVTSAAVCQTHPLSRVGVALVSSEVYANNGQYVVYCCECNARRYG